MTPSYRLVNADVPGGASDSTPGTKNGSPVSASVSGRLPLSVSQTGPWYLSRLAPNSTVCNELITIRKMGSLDVQALRRAFADVVARHEAWRTTFKTFDGVPHQFIREPTEVDLPFTDLSGLGRRGAIARATEIAVTDTLRPYAMADGPLIRPWLIRVTEDDHRLYIGLHCLVFDETSLRRTVFPELTALYRSYVTGSPSSLATPPAQYADYTKWELDWVRGPQVSSRISNWHKRLAGSAPTELPLDHPRPPHQTLAGGTIRLTIEHGIVDELRRAAHTAGGSLVDALAAAYAWWLNLYVDSTEVVFGIPYDLRGRDDLLTVVGYCVTAVVLRCEISSNDPFTTLVTRTRRAVDEALNEVVPFETLVASLGRPRDPRNNPLFQTMFLFRRSVTSAADEWSLHMSDADVCDAVGSAKFDVSIELDEQPDGHVTGALVFNTDLFERETARELAWHFHRILEVVAAAPEKPMAEHDLITPDERRRQLSSNRTTHHGTSWQCVHEVIAAQVERTPDAVAVQVGDSTLTYRQLDDRATAIASRLMQAGAGPGGIVAVLLQRTPDLIATLVGVLKSGAAFLPLDPRQPVSRNAFCINDAAASIIVTEGQLLADADELTATVVNIRDVNSQAPQHDQPSGIVTAADLAYVIYTSGSTGRPKGVLIEHRNLVNLMGTMYREIGVVGSDTVLSLASVSFDMAMGDIFCALACGARLVLATTAQAADPIALGRLIARSGATHMCATPTTWGALVAAGWGGDLRLKAMTGGESISDGLARALLQRCESVWNAYGPTEATVWTSVAQLVEGDVITVGRALPNVRVYITDSRGRLQPAGVPGEITIGGVEVARGYLNVTDERARRFGDDPFHCGGRMYRTGDRGRLLPDGRIQHLGRDDDQLKIRGFRIEPGEIESVLSEHPDVQRCAVMAREAPNGEQGLVAYVVGVPGRPTEAEARGWLRRRLPEYMVPSAFVYLNELPTTPSGKLDKAALPAPSRQASDAGAQPPRTDTERRVAGIWAELFATPVNDVHSDFFDRGGHSLMAARLVSEIQRTFDVELPLASFIDHGRTIADLAKLLDAGDLGSTDGVASGRQLHFIYSGLSSAMSLRHLTAQWGGKQSVHALIPQQPDGRFDLSVTIEQHASQFLSAIRREQPDGPLALAGYSIGGLLAYEIARQAIESGQEVEWLGLVDTEAPSLKDLVRLQLTLRWRLRRIRQLPIREQWAKYREVARRIFRTGSMWQSQEDFDYRGAAELVYQYEQLGHDVPMDLFVTEVSATNAESDRLGWDQFHKGTFTVHRVGGDHVSMLEPPNIESLARTMLESLRAARAAVSV
ncbi:Non-ribosomal peptide synthetase component F [Mycobacterium numidiamassiliense]|uniref:Non-ribosomal peptide synthetase component F n=1 Tax=Mycobacterium numidiamassiliense TaxID=1841861 RepID=A0A2U3PBG2_9MYCO|nr:non-ribosomal peptide synthetase [Mycobacterium numidiamassiliense]SPM41104.1 Non-ribosomal peptide synthetase component F [Mycobacterium numidiamassiliense]